MEKPLSPGAFLMKMTQTNERRKTAMPRRNHADLHRPMDTADVFLVHAPVGQIAKKRK